MKIFNSKDEMTKEKSEMKKKYNIVRKKYTTDKTIIDNIMIKLPNFHNPFDHENNFYLSCENSRIGKMIAHYELFQLSSKSQGHIVECGVFKGISLIRFATFLKLFKIE